ncbi:MAG: hypothetical protein ACRD0I_03885, partial [Acidimicrobiales bacterium]
LLAHPNPLASPTTFSAGVDLVRSWAQVGLGRIPTLILDEWNLSAAGFDHRMDTNSGAAFDAGVLTELQHSGLDAAVMFASLDPYWDNKQANPTGADEFGSWGLVTHGGVRKPAWWAFDLFGQVGPDLIAAATPGSVPLADGVRVLAGRNPGATTVLVSSWLATGGPERPVHLVVSGLGSGHSSASLYVIDARHSSAGSPVAVMSITDSLDFVLPAQSVILVRIIPTR